MGYALPGTRETWLAPNVHLATVLPPHAPRSQTSGFRSCTDPPPLATAGKPTAELRKAEQGPISTSGPSISVCHRTRRFLRTNQFVAPPLAFCSPIDHSLVPRGAQRQWLQAYLPVGHHAMPVRSSSHASRPPPHAPRPTPDQRGSGRAQAHPRWLLTDTDRPGSREVLLPPRPLRTGHESCPSSSSSIH